MPILECNQLSKSYGKVPALDGVSFAIEPGRIVGLLGPNGSGKTTLIKLANGLLTPDGGEIRIDGKAPGKETHAIVSYLPERTAIPTWMWAAWTRTGGTPPTNCPISACGPCAMPRPLRRR